MHITSAQISFQMTLKSKDFENMMRAPKWMVTLIILLACVQIFISPGISKLDQRVGRKITEQSNPGFISIDCGASEDYFDEETGIWYQSDKDFVETGKNFVVSSNANLNFPYVGRQLQTLRSFPDGQRNCYTLKPIQGKNNNYLIRAYYAYGNYDGKNQTPVFDVYLGVNYWYTVSWDTTMYEYYVNEMIHTALTDTIDVCLVKTSPEYIPFISTLELRLLNNSIYQTISTSQALLFLEARFDVAINSLARYKYKDDVYDRLWRMHSLNYWDILNSTANISAKRSNDTYKVPAEVLKSAAQSFSISYDFDSVWQDLDKSSTYYVYFHFTEIEQLPPGKKRIINITLNDENIVSEPIVLEYLKPVTISNKNPTPGYVRFNISATSESDAPAILNAFEIYRLITQLSSPTDTGDADAILDIKRIYGRVDWQGDPCVPTQYAWDGLKCNSDKYPRIISVNLSSSRLTGEITPLFSNLTELESLDLSNNELTGPLPEFLAKLPMLKILNLSRNKLSGPVPKALKEKADRTLKLSLADNPGLCLSDSCEKHKYFVPLIVSISAFIIVFLVSLGIWMVKRRRLEVPVHLNRAHSKLKMELGSRKQQFTYAEVLSITNNFERVVGKGGFGTVYHGYLGNTEVAVKMIFPSAQGYLQFQAEAELLTRVHHKCLTGFIGYCDDGSNMALIYEYMTNGDLAYHLLDKNENILSWKQRLQIAVDAAEGLEYLHNGCNPPIVHRDVKCRNILLNEKLRGKLSDFGLSKIFPNEGDTHMSTVIAGTPGYLDPEYNITNRLNEKSDVFSFGVVLLEIITGRPAIAKSEGKIHIINWVSSLLLESEANDIVDARLQGEFSTESTTKALDTAMACVAPVSINRPPMRHVVTELQQCLKMAMTRASHSYESSRNSVTDVSFDRISGESSLAR